MEIYKQWPQEVHLHKQYKNTYILQYNLQECEKSIVPFRIIEWCGCGCDFESSDWNEGNTEINIIYKGEIWFDGIRHSEFTPEDKGYINYIRLGCLSKGLEIIKELCLKYCNRDVFTELDL